MIQGELDFSSPATANHDRPTVLVVEDQVQLRRLMVQFLKTDNINSLHTGNAVHGLSLARQRAGLIDLAIVDMMLPGENGLDLASHLNREYPEMKILYISGYVESIAMLGIARLSPELVLFKPFTEQELLDRVHLLLESPARFEPASAGRPAACFSKTGTLS